MTSYELRLLSDKEAGYTNQRAAEIVEHRITKFCDAVARLTTLGWSMRLTPTGLEFDIPDGYGDEKLDDGSICSDLNGLNALARAGIPLEMVASIDACAPTPEDIDDAHQEFSDRLEYVEAHKKLADPATSVCCKCQDKLQAMLNEHEERYGARNLRIACDSEFEHGVLFGKVEALSWVLGESMTDPIERLQDRYVEQSENKEYANDWDDTRCSCDSHDCIDDLDPAFA